MEIRKHRSQDRARNRQTIRKGKSRTHKRDYLLLLLPVERFAVIPLWLIRDPKQPSKLVMVPQERTLLLPAGRYWFRLPDYALDANSAQSDHKM